MYVALILPASLGLLSLVAAQAVVSAPAAVSSSSTCDDMADLDACIQSTEAIAASYASTDYTGLCSAWGSVLVCFNDCPNDPRYSGVLTTQETYCNDASVYPSTPKPTPYSAPSVPAATPTPDGSGSSSGSGSNSGSGSGSNADPGSGGNVAAQTGASGGASSTGNSSPDPSSGASSEAALRVGQVVLGLVGFVGAMW